MPAFRNISIRGKQTLIIMLTSTVVLCVACASFIVFDTVFFRRELSQRVTILADAVGSNCAAAIDFEDVKAAEETLGALRADDSIVSACVYSHDGQMFAAYQRNTAAPFVAPVVRSGQRFTKDRLYVFRAIEQAGTRTGTIFVASNLDDISTRLTRYLAIAGIVFVMALLLALGLSSRLQRLVSDPILRLAQMTRSVALEKNYSVRATKQSNDELGELVDGFNEMLEQIQTRDTALRAARDDLEKRVAERTHELEDIHRQLVKASRESGMAEIATNVLHNVGNVLNSINVSTGLIVGNVKKSKASAFARVVGLLDEHAGDLGAFLTIDAKGKQIPAYLAQLSEHLTAEQEINIRELDSLRQNIEHIKVIVAMQQNYATFGAVTETVSVTALVEDSLRMNEHALSRHRVQVVREFEDVPPLSVEKHKILQILVNLLRNAKYACDEAHLPDRTVTVRVANGDGRVKISVIDNGVGIPPENLTRIFNHGFTTRQGGHGFGLHSGALAASEMGGSLVAESAGPGQGATFTLELPATPGPDRTHSNGSP